MRVWGRANGQWVEVTTGQDGLNQAVYVTWLAQVLKLNLNESPFWANWGIPQYQTIMTQIAPDFYVMQTQVNFSGKFAGLTIVREQGTVDPTYNISVLTKNGTTPLSFQVAIPT